MYLQGCLAYKRCSVFGLNSRYLKPYIKLKLIELTLRLYQKFWKKKLIVESVTRLLNASAWITFERYVSMQILFFAYLMCSSFFGAKAQKKKQTKKLCLRFAILNFIEKLQNNFWNSIKNIRGGLAKIAFEYKVMKN